MMKSHINLQRHDLRIGAATTEIPADDSMAIGGGIFPAFVSGQEGKLGASAIVLEKGEKICMVSCDVLMLQRDILDDVCRRIETDAGIPFNNILISATHTHHAPSAVALHGVEQDGRFCEDLKEAIIKSVTKANENLRPSTCRFACGNENTVGQNSRVMLDDGTILWVPLEEQYAQAEPTGPYIPDMPVLSFPSMNGDQPVVLFNHASHNIGSRAHNKRSPGFYGLAAQEMAEELKANVVFFSGAAGSTHNMTLTTDELVRNTKVAAKDTLSSAAEKEIHRLKSVKMEFEYKVRTFDETRENQDVAYYCNKRRVDWCDHPEDIVEVFRKMRQDMAKHQGEIRKSWLQVILIGDIAFVAMPGEFFGKLAQDLQARSPFEHTYVIGYANDYIGYIPDRDAYELGGYQIWTGLHSLVEAETGEMLVDKALGILNKLNSTATQRVSLS